MASQCAYRPIYLYIVNERGDFQRNSVEEVVEKIMDGSQLNVVIRRNLHLVFLLTKCTSVD
jgi:hypothetical protein